MSTEKVEIEAEEVADLQELEEARDVVPSLPRAPRKKTTSDITGIGFQRPRHGRKKVVSDISHLVGQKYVPAERVRRRRTKSTTDLITKFGQAPSLRFDDLKMAEFIAGYGDKTERVSTGSISEADFEELLERKEAYEEFEFNDDGLTSAEAEERLAKYGRNELPEKVTPKWLLFVQQFWAPMPIMIWVSCPHVRLLDANAVMFSRVQAIYCTQIAIIIELGISNYIDMAILLLIQFTNASISFYESNKAGNAIAALKSSLKPSATCKRDGKWQVLDAALLVPGDTVMLGSGSAVPADCRVNDSEIDVDQAALTGESLPVTFYKGDSVKMGSTVVRGEVEVSATSMYSMFTNAGT